MELTIKRPTIVKETTPTNGKIVQFMSASGVKKVYDVHKYGNGGTLYFKRKSEVAVA